MFLALDIGNSSVKGGLFDGASLSRVFSASTDRDAPPEGSDPWVDVLGSHLDGAAVEHVGLVSVVPETRRVVAAALDTLTEAPVTAVHPNMPLPFQLDYETPDTLGADRLAAAAAGWVQFGRPAGRSVLIVDAGTAVTYEVVHRDSRYQGGAITAGPPLIRRALHAGTAQLPSVSLSLPDRAAGRSTETALRSGLLWGLIDSVRGMVDRLSTSAVPDTPLLVLTGGWSALLAEHLDRVDHCAPHLVLEGVRRLVREEF